IEVPAGGTRIPVDADVLQKRLNTFVMHGSQVWEFAIETVPRVIRELLAEHGLSPQQLDLLILHQSNLRMIESLMSSLELPMDRTVTIIQEYGNTAVASIPITLERAGQKGLLGRGSRVALCGFGGGLSWGT